MSKGIGKFQRSILDYISNHAGPHSLETIRWEMYEADPVSREPLPEGVLLKSWNWKFERGIKTLEGDDRKELLVTRRPLQSKEEFVRHYPSKTLNAEIRGLRLKLLPSLAAYKEPEDDHCRTSQPFWETRVPTLAAPEYTAAQNEDWFVETRIGSQRNRLRQAWLELEPELFGQMSVLAYADQEALFSLIARVKALLKLAPMDFRRSIDECLGPLYARHVLPPGLSERLADFCSSLVPRETSLQLRFKSFIRSVALVPRRGKAYRLVDTALEHLNDTCSSFVASLPGYKPPPERRRHSWLPSKPQPTYPPILHKLVDNTVFAKFKFLSINPVKRT